MAAIGTLVFCTDCGNLLDGSSGDNKAVLTCDVCGTLNKGQYLDPSRALWPGLLSALISLQFHRYLIEDCHHEVQAHGFPIGAAVQTVSGPNTHRGRCSDRRHDKADLSGVWAGGDEVLHTTAKECGRREHGVLHL